MDLAKQIDHQKIPHHIAIIMDGNGRWATEHGENRLFGHVHGVESVRVIVESCAELGVEYLTLYAFSTENWDRPKEEVNGLMELLVDTLIKEVPKLHKNNVRIHVIGNIEMLPLTVQKNLQKAKAETSNNTGLNLVLALSYSSRWEICNAAQRIAVDVVAGKIKAEEVDQSAIEERLTTAGMPDPELMIRTSGEFRISNFLLYQLAYTELYFTPVLWPQFRKENLYEAIISFQQRERRFGKTGEQVSKNAC